MGQIHLIDFAIMATRRWYDADPLFEENFFHLLVFHHLRLVFALFFSFPLKETIKKYTGESLNRAPVGYFKLWRPHGGRTW
jgi:hypothetical protein